MPAVFSSSNCVLPEHALDEEQRIENYFPSKFAAMKLPGCVKNR